MDSSAQKTLGAMQRMEGRAGPPAAGVPPANYFRTCFLEDNEDHDIYVITKK